MLIKEPEPKVKSIHDMDFTFSNGIVMPITIDKEAGDEVDCDTNKDAIVIHLSAKPSLDGKSVLPAEDITVFRHNILVIQHRIREVTELTKEQQLVWQKTLQEAGATTVQ